MSAGERHALLAFSGTYQIKSIVTATTGSYAESVGAVHFYTWQVIPDCNARSCVVKVTSSTGSQTSFTYGNGEFIGIGHGSATCIDPSSGTPTGTEPTILHDALRPTTTSSPATSLKGVVDLTESGTCGSNGTGTFSYTLTRTGSVPPATSLT